MFKFLAKIFIADNENFEKVEVRAKYGMLCGVLGIFFNLLLTALKLYAGLITKSVAVVADAMNHLSDGVSSVITFAGFKIASKEPDKDHPFGHGRFEYIAGLAVSILILMMGFEVLKSSVMSIISPEAMSVDWMSVGILVFSIAVKAYMYVYNHFVAKKLNSATMEASAKDSFSDVISTLVVLVSMGVNVFFHLQIFDGVAGCVVAIFILKNGFESIKETIEPMLGRAPSSELVEKIKETVLSFEPICAIHDLIVHDYGPNRLVVSLHAEVPSDRDIFELHESIDNAELALAKKFNCSASIHMDPIDLKSPKNIAVREFLPHLARDLDSSLSVHDVRCIWGKDSTKVMFDVVKPYECKLSDSEIENFLSDGVTKKFPDCYCVMLIERPFV